MCEVDRRGVGGLERWKEKDWGCRKVEKKENKREMKKGEGSI